MPCTRLDRPEGVKRHAPEGQNREFRPCKQRLQNENALHEGKQRFYMTLKPEKPLPLPLERSENFRLDFQ